MTPHIVLLNGPAGVGKTTVAHRLATLTPGTICIAGDAVRDFAPADPVEARALLGPGSTYRAAAALAKAYLEMGARRIIVEYIFESPAQVEHFRRAAPRDVPLSLVTLWAPLAAIRAREASRIGRAPLGPQIEACYRAMEPHVEHLGLLIPTDGRTADQVAQAIEDFLRSTANSEADATGRVN